MKGFRWLGLPAVAALTVLLFALTAGVMFVRAVMQIRDPKPVADIPGGAA